MPRLRMSLEPHGGWLTSKEAAAFLRVHPKHLYRLLRQGLPGRRVGSQWRFSPAELQVWSRQGKGASSSVASKAGLHPQEATSTTQSPVLIVSPGELAVEGISEILHSSASPCLGTIQGYCPSALPWLEAGAVLAVALLGETGSPPSFVLARFHVAHVHVGLAASPGLPLPSPSLLARQRRPQLVSWPAGSDIRVLLDGALSREGIDSRNAHVDSQTACSHRDVVERLVRRTAQVGVTTAAWADRFGLPFVPLGSYPLGIIVRASSLDHPTVIRIWEILQGVEFARHLSTMPGYDPTGAGDIRYLPVQQPWSPAVSSSTSRPNPNRPTLSGTSEPSDDFKAPGWAAVVRERGEDCSGPLLSLVEHWQRAGLHLAGFVQVPCRTRGRIVSYDLRRIGGTGRVRLARRKGQQAGARRFDAFSLDSSAFATAREWLKVDAPNADIIVVDGLGTEEARGLGHLEAVARALGFTERKVVILGARRDRLAEVLQKVGRTDAPFARLSAGSGDNARTVFAEAVVAAAASCRTLVQTVA